MQLSHIRPIAAAKFDDPNLVSCAGLVPTVALAQQCGLAVLADERLTVSTDKGANAGRKITSLVAGMVAGADSIDDMALLRHGAMGTIFDQPYAPSTLGSFLREFTFGHVRQLDAVGSRFLYRLADRTPIVAGIEGTVLVDIDDTIIEVHGHGKQGSGYGYSGVRGLNALIATVSTERAAPVIVGQRLRKGSCGSARGAARILGDTLATVGSLRAAATDTATAVAVGAAPKVLVRADSAFYGYRAVRAAIRGGADVSVTVRQTETVKAAIAQINESAWTPIAYADAVYDENTGTWISRAEVAEIDFTAFTSRTKRQQIPGRLIVRRIPDLNVEATDQGALFDTWRFHAFFTTTDLDTVTADKTHRGHAIIEQVHADLKNSALAHLPSNHFSANAAWLVCAVIAFNLTRAAATLTGAPRLVKATTASIRRTLVSVPARIASSARRLTLHLPTGWPWETAWHKLFDSVFHRHIPIIG
jgi:Transposase DDE domain group 1